MKLHERLKLARANKGLTQQEVADTLHISRTTVSSWEVGRTLPSLDYIVDLSNLYDVSLDILLKEDMTMVQQINKDLKIGARYKKIIIGLASLLGIFILVNLIWFISVKQQYNYINQHWEKQEDSLIYQTKEIKMMAPSFDFSRLLTIQYLQKEPIWIMSLMEKESDVFLELNFVEDQVFATVPLTTNNQMISVQIDPGITAMKTENYPNNLISTPTTPLSMEDWQAIQYYLDQNKTAFQTLYQETDKQYQLINQN